MNGVVEFALRPLVRISPLAFVTCFIFSTFISSVGPWFWPDPEWKAIIFEVVTTWIVMYLWLGWNCSVVIWPQVVADEEDARRRRWVIYGLIAFFITIAIERLFLFTLTAYESDFLTVLGQVISWAAMISFFGTTWMAAHVFLSLEKQGKVTLTEIFLMFIMMLCNVFFVFSLKARLSQRELTMDN